MTEINPSKIMQVGMGFMASKTLLSAVELGVSGDLIRSEDEFASLRQEPDFLVLVVEPLGS